MNFESPVPRLFRFAHLYNVRDLGGYPTADGRYTRWRKYIRGSAEGFLAEEEKEHLYSSGVRMVVDLRHDDELRRTRSPLAGYRDIDYRHVNFLGGEIPVFDDYRRDMGDWYREWLTVSGTQIAQIFAIFARYPEQGIYFHCSIGKDRTGIITALILGLAGCAAADIVADYAESFDNNRDSETYRTIAESQKRYLYSKPEYMERMLRHLDEAYGGIPAYLKQIGLSAEELDSLRESFTAPAAECV